jgi:hypothetical protein
MARYHKSAFWSGRIIKGTNILGVGEMAAASLIFELNSGINVLSLSGRMEIPGSGDIVNGFSCSHTSNHTKRLPSVRISKSSIKPEASTLLYRGRHMLFLCFNALPKSGKN